VICIQRSKDKTVVFEFGSRPDNKTIVDFYRDNSGLLKRFGNYFSNTLAREIICEAEKQRLKPPSKMTDELALAVDTALYERQDENSFPLHMLTEIEKKYLQCLLRGNSNIEMSEKVGVSDKTISKHLLKMKEKMGCTHKSELFEKACLGGAISFDLNHIKPEDLEDPIIYTLLCELYAPIFQLSKQEYKCYKLILFGCTLAEISQRLDISIPTVSDYIKRVKYKLKCMYKEELFQHAIENGFMEINI
jgi:DNA-binding CsgD family transcriptional regulator